MGVQTHRRTPYSIIVLGMVVTACEPSTAPTLGVDFDSESTLSAYQTMDSLIASPTLAAFQALGGRTPFSSSPAAIEAVAALGGPDAGRAFALDLWQRIQRLDMPAGGPAGAPIISDSHRGVTFAYDPDADRYTEDPSRSDAPDDGVRFVLYEVDLTGRPLVEQEIGYADLVDEGDGSAEDVALHLRVVVHQTTVLEYRVSLDLLTSGGTLGVHGALQEPGGPRLDFDIEAAATYVAGRTTLDVAFDLRVESRDFTVTGTVSGVDEDAEGEGTVELVVRHGDDSIRVSVEGDGGVLDGSVFVNGALFATVSGNVSDPLIESATGDPLTLGELLVLRRIVDGVEDVFDFLEDLLDPVDNLVLLALIL